MRLPLAFAAVVAASCLQCGSSDAGAPGEEPGSSATADGGGGPGTASDGGVSTVDGADPNDGGSDPTALTTVPSLALGRVHSCALRADGTVYCWGDDLVGQLGRGTAASGSPSYTPTKVVGIKDVARLVAFGEGNCALLRSGTVACWGTNRSAILAPHGAIGASPNDWTATPRAIAGLSGVIELAAGSSHVCARKNDKSVWCWGDNSVGALGHTDLGDQECSLSVTFHLPCNSAPRAVAGVAADGLALGGRHSCARVGAKASCWGQNDRAQLGHTPGQGGDTTANTSFMNSVASTPPAAGIVTLFGATNSSCLLDAANAVSCWGYGFQSPAAPAVTSADPFAVGNMPQQVRKVTNGTCALAGTSVYCWGSTEHGALGLGPTPAAPRVAPTVLAALSGLPVSDVETSTDGGHSCALTSTGAVYCWGFDEHDELGHDPVGDESGQGRTFSSTPTRVAGLP